MTKFVTPDMVKAWLSDGREIAFADVRENGQFASNEVPQALSQAGSCL